MRSARRYALLTIIYSAALCAQTESDPKAIQLLAACRNAMGEASQSFSISGSGSIRYPAMNSDKTTQLSFRSTGSLIGIWTEATGGKVTARQWHGSSSRLLLPDGKTRRMGVSDSIYRVPDLVPSYACHLKANVRLTEVHYVGPEQHNGLSVDHLRMRADDGRFPKAKAQVREDLQSIDIYLDSGTHQILALSPQTTSRRAW